MSALKFTFLEECISFAENEGYTEWSENAEAELTLFRASVHEHEALQGEFARITDSARAAIERTNDRAEAAEQAAATLWRFYLLPMPEAEMKSVMDYFARAALACPPQQPENT